MRRGRAVGAPAATARRRAPRPDCSVWRPTVTAEPGLLALAPRSHAQRPSRRLRATRPLDAKRSVRSAGSLRRASRSRTGLQRLRLPRPDRRIDDVRPPRTPPRRASCCSPCDPWRLLVLESPRPPSGRTHSSAPAVCGPISSGRTIATTRPRSTNLGSACVRSPRPCAASTQRSSPRSRSPRPTRRRQRWWTTTSPSQARPPSYRLGRGGTPRDGSPTPSQRSTRPVRGPRPGRRGLAHPREAKAGTAGIRRVGALPCFVRWRILWVPETRFGV